MRKFVSGATRDDDEGKIDYEGFLSPEVLEGFGEYMTLHALQANGKWRPSDNWQKGIPKSAYMKSLLRHTMDVWKGHRGLIDEKEQLDALYAVLFNVQGYIFELLGGKK